MRIRRHTLKENVISFLIGVILGLPFCVVSFCSHADQNVSVEEIILQTDEVLYEAYTSSEGVLKVYEMTPDDIAEEEYWDSLELLACCVMAEAEGEDLMGKRMVVDVVLNRVDDPDFPDTITEVITQKYQFSSYWDGRLEKADPTEDCFTAVKMELEERTYPDILFFTAGRYSNYGTPWKQHGNHYFSTK